MRYPSDDPTGGMPPIDFLPMPMPLPWNPGGGPPQTAMFPSDDPTGGMPPMMPPWGGGWTGVHIGMIQLFGARPEPDAFSL